MKCAAMVTIKFVDFVNHFSLPAHPIRPPKFPAAIAIKYAEAKEAVTRCGMALVKMSPIIGFATEIRPMPPVASNVDVENSSQN